MSFSYALRIGNGGWVRWELVEHDLAGFVRFDEDDGRLSIHDLYIADAPSARDLLKIPLAALEVRANNDNAIGDAIRTSLADPAPLIATALSYFDATPRGAKGWVADMLKSQHPSWGVPRVRAKAIKPVIPVDEVEVNARLQIPETRPFPVDFYQRVASVYGELAARYRNPNARIADANEVSVKRVEQWVIKARELGFLGPAQHGRRG